MLFVLLFSELFCSLVCFRCIFALFLRGLHGNIHIVANRASKQVTTLTTKDLNKHISSVSYNYLLFFVVVVVVVAFLIQ